MSWFITGVGADPQLLDAYPGAAAAYSLRDLSWAYGGPVVRVRRSSDNTEQDFTAAQITDGTLTTFCGAGDGFVRTWYDQSGNNINATESVSTRQPRIVESGLIITANGLPALEFDGVDDRLQSPGISFNYLSIFAAANIVSNGSLTGRLIGFDPVNSVLDVAIASNASGFIATQTASGNISASQSTYGPALITVLYDAVLNNAQVDKNTTLLFGRNDSNSASGITSSQFNIGNWFYTGERALDFVLNEMILFPSNQSTNRTGIESNINAHYSIF